jgi:hypothetical protein
LPMSRSPRSSLRKRICVMYVGFMKGFCHVSDII